MSEKNIKEQIKIPKNLKRIQGHINTLYDSVTKNISFGKEVTSTKSSSHDAVLMLVKQIRKCATELLNNERRYTRRKYNHSMDTVLRNAKGNPKLLKAAKDAALKRIAQLQHMGTDKSSDMKTQKNRTSTHMNLNHNHPSANNNSSTSSTNERSSRVNTRDSSKDSQTNLGLK